LITPILQIGVTDYVLLITLFVPIITVVIVAMFQVNARIARLETKVDLLMKKLFKE
jgi:hypothetical protein